MKLTLFGATGDLGGECLRQALDAGHEVTVLVRSAAKLSAELKDKVTVVEGNGLDAVDVGRVVSSETEAVLFAIGIDRNSPVDLCTDVTRHILAAMRSEGVQRFIWCGGGSTIVEQDTITFGAKLVEWIARTFMSLRHHDKTHQYQFLRGSLDIDWLGVRPLQMRKGPRKGAYRLGFDTFNGMSSISFADCAHAMLNMLEDDTWMRKAPIIQY